MRKNFNHIIKIVLLFTLIFSGIQNGFSTHIVGGTMSYECLGGDQYKITLTLYRDCNGSGAQFDNNAAIGVYNNSTLITTQLSPFTFKTPVPVIINNPCLIAPPDVCVEKTEYTEIFNLPSIPGGYEIVYQRCCRGAAAINIVNPSVMGSTYSVHIPETNEAICNNSPTFNNIPPTMMCAGYEFTYDLSATDIDGDSLYYTFTDAITGGSPPPGGNPAPNPPAPPPYTNIVWDAGYSTNYQIDANPAFTIDPQTGFLIGTPTNIGAYTFNIGVKEYRNGVFINEVYRDFLLYVTNCSTNTVADFSDDPILGGVTPSGQSIFCNGTTVNTINSSTNSDFYFWDFGDPTTLTDTSSLESPTYTYADTGVYDITLIANPGFFCADTASHQFTIHPALNPSFITPASQCLQGNQFDFNAIGNNHPDDTITWDFGAFGIPQNGNGANVQTSYPNTGTFPIEITLKNFGCTETYIDSVSVLHSPTASFSPQTTFCNGLSVTFNNNNTNNTSSFWNFGDANNSIMNTPTHTFADSGSYNVMLVAAQQNSCFDTTYHTYNVYPELIASFQPQASQCLINNLFTLNAVGNFNSSATINWDFGAPNIPTNNNSIQTQISYDGAGTFPVSLSVQNYGCTSSYFGQLEVFLEPQANFTIPNHTGCQPFKPNFINSSTSSTSLSYLWNLGNGVTSNETTPKYTYFDPGTYDISLIASANTGCIGSDTLHIPNAITVNPTPEANFLLYPTETYFINHQIKVTDNSSTNIHEFNFGDGTTTFDSIATHSYDEPGLYTFNHYVINNFGCSNSAEEKIWIKSDFLFFAPNSFTPDGDGLNDFFLINVDGILAYDIKLFNRWGEVIFNAKDPTNGWNGKLKGKEVPQGVYTWKVILKTIDHTIHKKVGHVNLIR